MFYYIYSIWPFLVELLRERHQLIKNYTIPKISVVLYNWGSMKHMEPLYKEISQDLGDR